MNDINGYINRMNKSMDYKKFWFDKVDTSKFDTIIDFGCGDGTLGLEILAYENFKDKKVVFYETAPDMVEKLRSNLEKVYDKYQDRIIIVSDYEHLRPYLLNKRTCIIFSSVLHECYTFNTLPFLWEDLECAYIIIRDMCCDYKVEFSIKDKWKIFVHSRKKHYFDFFRRYGFSDKSHLHFLLKHLYKDNWNTEVLENYFAVPWNLINGKITNPWNNTFIRVAVHNETYNIPFLTDYSRKQFGVDYDFNTHINLIYKRIGYYD